MEEGIKPKKKSNKDPNFPSKTNELRNKNPEIYDLSTESLNETNQTTQIRSPSQKPKTFQKQGANLPNSFLRGRIPSRKEAKPQNWVELELEAGLAEAECQELGVLLLGRPSTKGGADGTYILAHSPCNVSSPHWVDR